MQQLNRLVTLVHTKFGDTSTRTDTAAWRGTIADWSTVAQHAAKVSWS